MKNLSRRLFLEKFGFGIGATVISVIVPAIDFNNKQQNKLFLKKI